MLRDKKSPAPTRRALPLAGAAALVAVIGAAGCGNVDPVIVEPGCPQGPLRGPQEWEQESSQKLIDDFEDGDINVARAMGRDGSWVLGVEPTSATATAAPSSRCAGRGNLAGHFAGEGFTMWGANWTALFHPTSTRGTAVPYDGSRWGGLSFWVAAGERAIAPYELPVGMTTLDVAWNGGVCLLRCMDFYRKTVSISRSWQRVSLRFDELQQEMWGDVQVEMRRDQLVGFILWPSTVPQFDIWIDDVRLEP
jgi:hypothetical protein